MSEAAFLVLAIYILPAALHRSVMTADLFAIYNYFLLLPIRTFSQLFHKNSDFVKRKSRPKAADSIMAHLLYTL